MSEISELTNRIMHIEKILKVKYGINDKSRLDTIEDEHDTEIRELKRLIKRLDLAMTGLKVTSSQMEQGYGEQLKYMDERIKKLEPSEQKPSSPSIPSAWKKKSLWDWLKQKTARRR